jgi:hypothetical protein
LGAPTSLANSFIAYGISVNPPHSIDLDKPLVRDKELHAGKTTDTLGLRGHKEGVHKEHRFDPSIP